MLNVNDFKLVPLEALVHDEALFKSYLDFIAAVSEIYDIEQLNLEDEIDLGDDYVWEDQVMSSETRFWKSNPDADAARFYEWSKSKAGYWSRYESDTDATYKVRTNVLVRHDKPNRVLGRSNLYSGLDKDRWTGMGFDCIHPDERGEGLGRVILAHRFNQARLEGVEEMKLNVRNDNMGSVRRFEKLQQAGLTFKFKSVSSRRIAWFNPILNLDESYAILTAQSAPPSEEVSPEI